MWNPGMFQPGMIPPPPGSYQYPAYPQYPQQGMVVPPGVMMGQYPHLGMVGGYQQPPVNWNNQPSQPPPPPPPQTAQQPPLPPQTPQQPPPPPQTSQQPPPPERPPPPPSVPDPIPPPPQELKEDPPPPPGTDDNLARSKNCEDQKSKENVKKKVASLNLTAPPPPPPPEEDNKTPSIPSLMDVKTSTFGNKPGWGRTDLSRSQGNQQTWQGGRNPSQGQGFNNYSGGNHGPQIGQPTWRNGSGNRGNSGANTMFDVDSEEYDTGFCSHDQETGDNSKEPVNADMTLDEDRKNEDWTCSIVTCGEGNSAWRTECKKCGCPKRTLEMPTKENIRSGDWQCNQCQEVNFAKREICRRCNLGKGEQPRKSVESNSKPNRRTLLEQPGDSSVHKNEKLTSFEQMFEGWEKKYEEWKYFNNNNPDRAYVEMYQNQMEAMRIQLLEKRESIIQKCKEIDTKKKNMWDNWNKTSVNKTSVSETPDNNEISEKASEDAGFIDGLSANDIAKRILSTQSDDSDEEMDIKPKNNRRKSRWESDENIEDSSRNQTPAKKSRWESNADDMNSSFIRQETPQGNKWDINQSEIVDIQSWRRDSKDNEPNPDISSYGNVSINNGPRRSQGLLGNGPGRNQGDFDISLGRDQGQFGNGHGRNQSNFESSRGRNQGILGSSPHVNQGNFNNIQARNQGNFDNSQGRNQGNFDNIQARNQGNFDNSERRNQSNFESFWQPSDVKDYADNKGNNQESKFQSEFKPETFDYSHGSKQNSFGNRRDDSSAHDSPRNWGHQNRSFNRNSEGRQMSEPKQNNGRFSNNNNMQRQQQGDVKFSSRTENDSYEQKRLFDDPENGNISLGSSQDHSMKVSSGNRVMIDSIISTPGRNSRPPRLVIIMRGLPGAGKSHLAKLIKEKEVSEGVEPPRTMALDDYFDCDGEYSYEAEMEELYRSNLIKSFKKNIDGGYFPFIIVDAINQKVDHFRSMWSHAKQNGFEVYICDVQCEVVLASARNIHGRSVTDISHLKRFWEPTPSHMNTLDVLGLLQDDAIEHVEMVEASDDPVESREDSPTEKDEDEEVEDQSFLKASKWEILDKEEKMARLDDTSSNFMARMSNHSTIEDWLELGEEKEPVPEGKKRVRWADLEERKSQAKADKLGFVVGQTNWATPQDREKEAKRALAATKFIPNRFHSEFHN